ncbi:MAG TPA: cyclopropane fatty acyl phospholipid synthase, partial [Rhodothermia bacterium]|nr:cyclopropane fatty acyl phospholipid synthase [Rhodothermia bacterium]
IADVRIGGDRPWDISVHDPRFYGCVLSHGAMGLGESYVDGWWDAHRIDEFIHRVLRARLHEKVRPGPATAWLYLTGKLANRRHRSRTRVGDTHYDRGNDLFQAMLDRRMTYSCAYWDDAETLDAAQENKLDMVCRKLGLTPGMSVLDIGCGWGSFAGFAAERYSVIVTGINNSKEQVELGSKLVAGLPVEIRYQDYRDVEGTFDRVVSIGMFEHVGPENYAAFMDVARRRLKDDGLLLLHTIGANEEGRAPEDWVERYIFPGSALPTPTQIANAFQARFVMEDWHNLSVDYDKTLLAWYENFDAKWDSLRDRYGDRFYRTWKNYLLTCAGAFRARYNQVWQVVLSKHGVEGGYRLALPRWTGQRRDVDTRSRVGTANGG